MLVGGRHHHDAVRRGGRDRRRPDVRGRAPAPSGPGRLRGLAGGDGRGAALPLRLPGHPVRAGTVPRPGVLRRRGSTRRRSSSPCPRAARRPAPSRPCCRAAPGGADARAVELARVDAHARGRRRPADPRPPGAAGRRRRARRRWRCCCGSGSTPRPCSTACRASVCRVRGRPRRPPRPGHRGDRRARGRIASVASDEAARRLYLYAGGGRATRAPRSAPRR